MMETLLYTVLPGERRSLTIHTGLAGNCCTMQHHKSGMEPKELYADSFGILKFYVYPPNEAGSLIELEIQIKDRPISLKLRAHEEETDEYPFHQPIRPNTESCKQRPALTDDEAQNLSDEELVRRGYSPRPVLADGKTNENWLRSVRNPATYIEPVAVPRKSKRRKMEKHNEASSFGESSNWCGMQLKHITVG